MIKNPFRFEFFKMTIQKKKDKRKGLFPSIHWNYQTSFVKKKKQLESFCIFEDDDDDDDQWKTKLRNPIDSHHHHHHHQQHLC